MTLFLQALMCLTFLLLLAAMCVERTTTCPTCTGRVQTIDGLQVEHRHRDQLGPCPAGQVPAEREGEGT